MTITGAGSVLSGRYSHAAQSTPFESNVMSMRSGTAPPGCEFMGEQ
jgi:hypothetical protein